jgi:hypothetical protein
MALGLFLISGGLLLLAAAIVAWPLLFHHVEPYRAEDEVSTPFSERDALLEALSELELEYQAGKLAQADYESAKARYERDYLALVERQG